VTWTTTDLLKLDARYAAEGVHLHQRPFRTALDILGPAFAMGFGGNPDVERIMAAYRALVPEVDENWPGAGVGLIASVDRVRKFVLPVVFGDPGPIEPWRGLGFSSPQEWWTWCRGDKDVAAETAFGFADVHDFANGFDGLRQSAQAAAELWTMARSNLEDVANALPNSFSMDSIIQPICLTAELALKGALVWTGVPSSSLRDRKGMTLPAWPSGFPPAARTATMLASARRWRRCHRMSPADTAPQA